MRVHQRAAVAGAVLVAGVLPAAQAGSTVDPLFRETLGFSAADMRAFDAEPP